ncbi:D-alanyl-D-alanine carboxypeptidase [Crossiella equi]|uniref:D-alanyl-D-alanine carboxypeptidase n=1 Tax=Crossiella equi TaxID=130796 RepID=A0ABS5AL43_9PSEU|nr:serine hydrolase domain-containing protein [Crossiella equi]MBP2477288.1 D-alanyl-D-alanine carboxypeptidase [Crossiella equi]
MTRRLAALATLVPLLTGLLSGTPPAEAGTRLHEALRAVVAAGAPAAYAATGTERLATGVAELGSARPPNPRGRFRAASVTKTFVATVVLQLAAEHKLSLDAPVTDHLPSLLPYRERITLRQLLSHTSGLPRDIPHWATLPEIDTRRWARFTPEQLVHQATNGIPLLFPPGTRFEYSNTAYTVLGLVVERVTGHSLAWELTTRLFRPLNLRDTDFPTTQPFLQHATARGYEQLHPTPAPPTDVTTYVMSRVWASGNLTTTTQDLNTFFKALLTGHLLPPTQLQEMKTARPNAIGPFGYGLGLMTLPSPCGGPPWWGHGGDWPGFNTWSLHAEDTTRQLTAGMTMDLTAPREAHIAMLNQVLTAALCPGPLPRSATTITSPDLR